MLTISFHCLQTVDYDGPVTMTIFYDLGSQNWTELGQTTIYNLSPGKMAVPRSTLSKLAKEAQVSAEKNPLNEPITAVWRHSVFWWWPDHRIIFTAVYAKPKHSIILSGIICLLQDGNNVLRLKTLMQASDHPDLEFYMFLKSVSTLVLVTCQMLWIDTGTTGAQFSFTGWRSILNHIFGCS